MLIPSVRKMVESGYVDAAGKQRDQNLEEELDTAQINVRSIAALQGTCLDCVFAHRPLLSCLD